MNSRLFGGILLIVGTTIGAGMLALPVATAQIGFWGSILLLVVCWAIMVASSFLFLEVNLALPPNTNLISMAGATLGKPGQAVVWAFYLLLLYSILSAYISGGGDLLHYLFSTQGVDLPFALSVVIFTCLFGFVVYLGIRSVDYVNRGLMLGKMGSYFLLVVLILPFVSKTHLGDGEFKHIMSPTGINIAILSFTSMMIIPSLRTYFNEDVKMLRKAVFFGTLIPLFCYIAWDMAILGVIPLHGESGMQQILHSSNPNSDLVQALTSSLKQDSVTVLAKFFTSICMATSFLSISLCLSDFLSDGLKVEKRGLGNVVIFSATFLPPILIAVYYPQAFIGGLKYAGLSCFILMIFMPAMMAWRARYGQGGSLALEGYQIGGGKLLLIGLLLFATLMMGYGFGGMLS